MTKRRSKNPPQWRCRKKGVAGFTLLEVMLAGAIFLLALAGTIQGISLANREYEHHRRATAGLAVIESVMEELLLLQASDPLVAAGAHSREYDIQGEAQSGGALLAEWTVSMNIPASSLLNLRSRSMDFHQTC